MNSNNILYLLLSDLLEYDLINISSVDIYTSFLVDKLIYRDRDDYLTIEFDFPRKGCMCKYIIPIGENFEYGSYSDIFGEELQISWMENMS